MNDLPSTPLTSFLLNQGMFYSAQSRDLPNVPIVYILFHKVNLKMTLKDFFLKPFFCLCVFYCYSVALDIFFEQFKSSMDFRWILYDCFLNVPVRIMILHYYSEISKK